MKPKHGKAPRRKQPGTWNDHKPPDPAEQTAEALWQEIRECRLNSEVAVRRLTAALTKAVEDVTKHLQREIDETTEKLTHKLTLARAEIQRWKKRAKAAERELENGQTQQQGQEETTGAETETAGSKGAASGVPGVRPDTTETGA